MEWQNLAALIGIAVGLITIIAAVLGGISWIEKRLEKKLHSELEPIKEQVNNHIPTQIKEIEQRIKESEQRIIDRMDALFKAYHSK